MNKDRNNLKNKRIITAFIKVKKSEERGYNLTVVGPCIHPVTPAQQSSKVAGGRRSQGIGSYCSNLTCQCPVLLVFPFRQPDYKWRRAHGELPGSGPSPTVLFFLPSLPLPLLTIKIYYLIKHKIEKWITQLNNMPHLSVFQG